MCISKRTSWNKTLFTNIHIILYELTTISLFCVSTLRALKVFHWLQKVWQDSSPDRDIYVYT